jgi:hypothetical protein
LVFKEIKKCTRVINYSMQELLRTDLESLESNAMESKFRD